MAEEKKAEEATRSEAPESKPAAPSEHGTKKISRLTLAEVEQALAKAEKSMGGRQSHYVRSLLARREFLKTYAS